jgi:hypothetical protein
VAESALLKDLEGVKHMENADQARELHERFAIELFNLVWDLMDREVRTPEEDDRMLHAAHASRFHWGEIGTPLEFERGEWQISRVYSVLKRPEGALFHARRCLEICEAGGIGDFDLAFAYEAHARACSVAGDASGVSKYMRLAEKAGEAIAEEDNRSYFVNELNTIPGFGKL